jgi:hypothetical protein
MSKSLRTLFVSVEDENDINETTLEVSSDNTMEEEVSEVAEAGIEVIEAEDDVEELHEIAEGLESIVASLESAVEDGGLDAQAAIFMQHAIHGYTRRVGLEADAIVPSLESFGGASGKAAATTISVESVKETIQKIWQAIKNAVAKAIQAVTNFFAKLIGGTKKLKERSKALAKSVKELSSKKVDAEARIKVPATNTLRYKGKVDVSSINTGMTALVSAMDKKELTSMAKEYYTNVSVMLDKGEELAKQGEEKLIAQLAKGNATVDLMSKAATSIGLMSGDATFKSNASSEGGVDTPSFPTLQKGVGSSIAEGTEISVPKQSELETILKNVDAVIKSIEGKDAVIKSITAERDRSIKAGDKLAKKAADGKLETYVKQAQVQKALRMANFDATSLVRQLSSHGFNVARGGLALVDRSVNAYKDK